MDLGKSVRHRALRDIVSRQAIRTQRELATALKRQGIPATQATLSRDITELGLIKVTRGGLAAYALPPRLVEAGHRRTAERHRQQRRGVAAPCRPLGHPPWTGQPS